MTHSPVSFVALFLKGILAGFLYLLGSVLFGILIGVLHLSFPNFTPPGVDPQASFRSFMLVCPILGLALLPLAHHTAGSRLIRGLALFFLLFICLGVNAVIEMRMFTVYLAHGGALLVVASTVLSSLFCGLALSYVLKPVPPESSLVSEIRSFFSAHSFSFWAWRLILAIFAFPAIFFLFGMMVAPFVLPVYRAGGFGLVLPPVFAFLPFEFIRSAFFLLASLPFLILWKGTRGSLILSLGLAHWVLVGLFGLLQVFWFPPVLRIAHSLEIAADSFVYAAVLVLLLLPRRTESPVTVPARNAPVFPS